MIVPLLKGLAVTLKYFFSKPFARQYPEERVEMTDRWRGIHYFERKEDGSTKCVACGLCEAVCPSNCIYVEAEEYKNGNRFPRVYEIDGRIQEWQPVSQGLRDRWDQVYLLRLL
jgi:formate hydrogenlyase subunit 6/NADH:ubiquinone oxidoreductase subunit I